MSQLPKKGNLRARSRDYPQDKKNSAQDEKQLACHENSLCFLARNFTSRPSESQSISPQCNWQLNQIHMDTSEIGCCPVKRGLHIRLLGCHKLLNVKGGFLGNKDILMKRNILKPSRTSNPDENHTSFRGKDEN
ncbi:MAG: hypothetical protein V3U24_00830 [Candidatus Neomarinimicrobiota bacterium]